ncbi:phosphatase PAP2 family protein [Zavarzinia compransoris]|nr:phosphatase PAP2 family protein [Zavarzinia compransoris]TDP46382.1 undecaprenyl-diphosphatase [Zavarzinia compransoris]
MLALVMFALASGALFAFAQLTGEVLEGETRAFDEAVLLALRQPQDVEAPIGPAWLRIFMTDLTSLGSATTLTLITVLTASYLALTARRGAAVFVLASVAGGWLLSTALKLGVARPRPDIVGHLVVVNDLSFPSGHAMLSTVTFLTLGALLAQEQKALALRLYFIGSAILLAVGVGFSRIYLGVHYPTDVVGGWSAGTGWAVACWLFARRLLARAA